MQRIEWNDKVCIQIEQRLALYIKRVARLHIGISGFYFQC